MSRGYHPFDSLTPAAFRKAMDAFRIPLFGGAFNVTVNGRNVRDLLPKAEYMRWHDMWKLQLVVYWDHVDNHQRPTTRRRIDRPHAARAGVRG